MDEIVYMYIYVIIIQLNICYDNVSVTSEDQGLPEYVQ